jgi:flavin reductase
VTPSAADFRSAVSRFPTGVTLLTSLRGDLPVGLTANAFVSVSLDPLLVLISVQRSARFHEAVLEAGVFGVSVLAGSQEDVSRAFAKHGRQQRADAFAPWPHTVGKATGCVLLDESLATLEARTVASYPGGDHTLVVGQVLSVAEPRPDAPPLIYHESRYRAFEDADAELDDPVGADDPFA